jgi:hypothetical protein
VRLSDPLAQAITITKPRGIADKHPSPLASTNRHWRYSRNSWTYHPNNAPRPNGSDQNGCTSRKTSAMTAIEAKDARDSPIRWATGLCLNFRAVTASRTKEPTVGKMSVLTEMTGPGNVRQLVTRRNAESATCAPQTQRHGEVRGGEKQYPTKIMSRARARISGRITSKTDRTKSVMVMATGTGWLEKRG